MATDFNGPKLALHLRPWQLPHRADFGLRGTSEFEVQHQLMQLICLNGLQTNPDCPGCERVVGTWLQKEWLQLPREEIEASDFNAPPEPLGPEKIFMVKGWNRSVCGLGVLYAAFKNKELLKESAATFATAYALGKHEAAATMNLMRRIPSDIKEGLTSLVPLQKISCLFVACVDQFKSMVPTAFSDAALIEVEKRNLEKGSMDVKYFSDRYDKGKAAVDKLTVLIADATLWPTRALSIDEAVQVAQGVTSGNPKSGSFWFLPQWHSSAVKVAVLKNRRLLEDEVALAGAIDDVDRARVNELSNPEPDKPLVQQRGAQACVDIIKQVLTGMHTREAHPLLIVDLGPGLGCCAKYAESCQQLVCGRAMQQWWDISEAAGPKARASEPFSEGIPELECLTVVDNELKLEAFAPLAREPSVEVAFTKSGNLWLVNRGVAAVNLTRGADVEVPAGQVTKKAGPDGGQIPLKFHYEVQPDTKINAFKPKPLADNSGLRAGQFGGIFHDRILQIPTAPHCDIVWEVKVGEEVPAVVTPLKPKYYLLASCSIGAGEALKLK
ncbi:unnamed protein product [Durusdinium trenchii]|uniref:Uncharacterized protein n=1 Tax=Durusdinium trenchii TaxID=1381693 RepID=A0ABP0Q8Q9_9DINO